MAYFIIHSCHNGILLYIANVRLSASYHLEAEDVSRGAVYHLAWNFWNEIFSFGFNKGGTWRKCYKMFNESLKYLFSWLA